MPKFIPRQRKHKVLQRQKDRSVNGTGNDSNILEIQPAVPENARDQMRADLRRQAKLDSSVGKVSAKKARRMDKYIDKKLRKEENLQLLKQLASSKVDTALLKSSRSLGVTKLSRKDLLTQALHERDAGVDVEKNQEVLSREDGHLPSDESDDSDFLDKSSVLRKPAEGMLGGGLKRPLDVDDQGNAIIKKRKRIKTVVPQFPNFNVDDDTEGETSSWEGFDSGSEDARSHSSDSEISQTSEDEVSDESDAPEEAASRKERSSAFKAWARTQINQALDFVPSSTETGSLPVNTTMTPEQQAEIAKSEQAAKANFTPRPVEIDPLPPELGTKMTIGDRKSHSVIVDRAPDIQEARLHLPMVAEEQRIMEAIHNNSCVVIAGETGSGKTTQVPQFLYEAGYGEREGPTPGMIGITQPRRVAAISMATRVAEELGSDHTLRVGHQIRYDSSVKSNTAIKFMTDGVLIREIAMDFVLSKYSVIVIDEAHERSTNTDILIGLMSRIVNLREDLAQEDGKTKPLKLIIMSASLRVQDFLGNRTLFTKGPPPLVQVEGRQFPVTTHFTRKTESDYVEQAFKRIKRGHQALPPGGMLVFLTGQDEIHRLAKQLEEALCKDNGTSIDLDTDLDSSDDEMDKVHLEDPTSKHKTPKVRILPLYAQMQTSEQLKIFDTVLSDTRLIVLATNVAETSLTIPGIRYVFDCGRAKEKKYDDISGVQTFEVGWISKASASQRSGRAGRTGPGHCYRLYSSAIYERDFEEHTEPEIVRMPVEGVVLQLKNMELHNVVNFPFPTPPDRHGLAKAERLLINLGALDSDGRIASLGRRLSSYPISPRYAKMLEIGHQHNCMIFTIILVAALATPNLFLLETHLDLKQREYTEVYTHEDRIVDEARDKRRSDFNHAHHLHSRYSSSSDAMKAFAALHGYLNTSTQDQYCREMFLIPKSIQEAGKLFSQLSSIIRNNDPLRFSAATSHTSTPSKTQIAALQQFAASGFLDQIAILASLAPTPPYLGRTPKRAIDAPYLPLTPILNSKPSSDTDIRDIAVYIHPSSILARLPLASLPKYIIYTHLQRSSTINIEGKVPKTRMHALTTIDERVLGILARGTPLLEYGKPVGKSEESIDPSGGGKVRTGYVGVSLVRGKGQVGMGWPLPPQKVVQRRDTRGEWIVQQHVE